MPSANEPLEKPSTRWGGVASRHDGARHELHDHHGMAPPLRLAVSGAVGIFGATLAAWSRLGATALWYTGAAFLMAIPLVPIAYLVPLVLKMFVPHRRRAWRQPLTSLLYAALALAVYLTVFSGKRTLAMDVSGLFLALTMLIGLVAYVVLSAWRYVRHRRRLARREGA